MTALIARADVLAIGPGLGQDAWARTMFEAALGSGKPTVIDADALNLLAQSPRAQRTLDTDAASRRGRALARQRPRPTSSAIGSALRRTSPSAMAASSCSRAPARWSCSAIELPSICDQRQSRHGVARHGRRADGSHRRNRGADCRSRGRRARGVLVHAMAGDMAARRGERGLLATDLFTYLPTCVNPAQRIVNVADCRRDARARPRTRQCAALAPVTAHSSSRIEGELGAGKTTLVGGVLAGVGVAGRFAVRPTR